MKVDSKDSGHRVKGTGDSTQHRRNGQQMRKDADQDDGASPEPKDGDVQTAAEPAEKSAGGQYALNITA
jgi:hypothetical protein